MGTLLVLLVSLGLGVLAHAHWRLAPQVLKVARGWVIWVALPAVILKEIPKLTIGQDAVLALVAGWWVFVGALGFCLALGQLWGWSRGTVAALVLTAGLGNTRDNFLAAKWFSSS